MKAQNNNSGQQLQETQKNSSSIKGGFEMKMASKIQNVMVNLLNGMKITVPAKLLGGLALGAILMAAVALPSGNAQASPLTEPPVTGMTVDIEDEGGTGRMFEAWEFGEGTNPYANQRDSSQVGVLAAPLLIAEPLVDVSDLGGGITDFEEAYTSEVSMDVSDLGGITDFEEAYTSEVSMDIRNLGGGITDFEEAWTSKVRMDHDQNEQANIFPEVEL